jgi:hypothetical protein
VQNGGKERKQRKKGRQRRQKECGRNIKINDQKERKY